MNRKILICGGGTGGHFFCGLAFAEKYLELFPQSEVHFLGVRRGIEGRYQFQDSRMKIHFVQSAGFKNMGWLEKFNALMAIGLGSLSALRLLWKLKPWLVMGVGGYSSVPGVVAALLLRAFLKMRIVVVDQNSSPGLANKIFSKLWTEAYSGFPSPGFEAMELPLRKSVEQKLSSASELQWPPRRILITGGSQGALALNQAWMGLLAQLKEYRPDFEIVHQTGTQGFDYVKAAYENLGIQAEVFTFSNQLSDYLASADLVVSRAGALSLFELMAYRRPAVLIPFPQAADNHQFKNAEAVQIIDWIIPQSQLNWSRFREILDSSRPAILEWKKGPRLSWKRVFRPL